MPRITSSDISEYEVNVKQIIQDVIDNGDNALFAQTLRFDDIELDSIKVDQNEFKKAWDELDDSLKTALTNAKDRIEKVHRAQFPKNSTVSFSGDSTVTNRYIAIERVGLYVPGGQAVYPSSVLMNVIPAQIAGVKNICIATPPQKNNNGLPHKTILAACYLLGINDCVRVGGAGAIAAFAYGTKSIKRVDKITGPGNIYVATAKQLVQNVVGIDSVAGPTEIMIIADENANAKFVAADLIGQAEHDELAASVLVTNSAKLVEDVKNELPEMIENEYSAVRIKKALNGSQSALILVKNLNDCVKIANAYGAEHLEIQTKNATDLSKEITNAGAIFIGDYSPVSLGDYIAGSNHVLPTNGSSRFSSGLNVLSFMKLIQEIHYNASELNFVQNDINILANDEVLPAHANAVNVRFS